ncbi:MAG: DUF1449 family protein [Planctomycetota bacterium]|jgi:hypothetical protein|nr:DUF1449 family protein [Planctomycetota bacterium]
MEFFHQIITVGMLPYTIFLGIVVSYWLFMIIGFVGIDLLDFDVDMPDIDGLDGAADGAIDGAIDGAADAVGDGAIESAGDAIEGSMGAFKSLLAFLNIGTVPATIVLSFISVKLWFLAYVFNFWMPSSLRGFFPPLVMGLLAFGVFFVTSAALTHITTRPFRRIFLHKTTHGQHHLVGKICVVKSTELAKGSKGQAELTVHDSDLLLDVQTNEENGFKRGEEAIIIDYESEKDVYEIVHL